MKLKYYIATGLANAPAHNELRDRLNSYGHTITYDWTEHGAAHDGGHELCAKVAVEEINGVRNADVVIVLWPGGRGTHAELGAAIASDKAVIMITDEDQHHNVEEGTCAFYYHPNVRLCRSVEEMENLLRNFN